MKRLIVLLLVLTLLYSSASADWDVYSIYPTTKEVFDQIESPYDLINGTYYDETPFFLGYLVAMNIRAEDILKNPKETLI